MAKSLNILMVAAENDALPGGKVGGIGDVVRDVPPALAAEGCRVTVVTPSYGSLAILPGEKRVTAVEVGFAGGGQRVEIYEVPGRKPCEGVRHWVMDHPLFSVCGKGQIYCNDPPEAPFSRDASKFALFCVAVAEGMTQGAFGQVDVLHLHDWHAAFVLILRRYHPAYRSLHDIRSVFSIHNLALQGVRPFSGNVSSLDAWYPGLIYDWETLADPRWPDCVNPMAVGVRLADAVHTVSPSYAAEIMQPSAVLSRGYYGGEGLETDLYDAHEQGRLHGILNGCEYPDEPPPLDWPDLAVMMRSQVLRWAGTGDQLAPGQFIALARLDEWARRPPGTLVTSVSRITEQKIRLLHEKNGQGRTALEGVLEVLGERGLYVLLGSGDPLDERFLVQVASRYSNFVFLQGYSDAVAQALYRAGDLFLMPSSFEPCGISQMLAMRAGQPCLVHHVGGLRDTVEKNVSGFAFTGGSLKAQADEFVVAFEEALALKEQAPERWQSICEAAAQARFQWKDSVTAYISDLYNS